jgi:pimeloyl-ACP methyl ester carboxylesterase
MFHMTAASSAAFEPLMQELDGKFPLIAFDTVNYGESYRTDHEPSIAFIAEVMLEALTALGVDRFYMYGHHTGVNIATEIALKVPDRVAGVLAHGPNYISMEANAFCMETMAKPNPIHVKGTQLIWAWNRVKDNMGEVVWLNPPRIAEILNRDTIDMLRAGENWHWGYRAVFAHDLVTAFKQIKCPLLVLWGRREPLHAFEHYAEAARDVPHALTYEHPEGGVYAHESYPADFAEAVAGFIGSLSSNGD